MKTLILVLCAALAGPAAASEDLSKDTSDKARAGFDGFKARLKERAEAPQPVPQPYEEIDSRDQQSEETPQAAGTSCSQQSDVGRKPKRTCPAGKDPLKELLAGHAYVRVYECRLNPDYENAKDKSGVPLNTWQPKPGKTLKEVLEPVEPGIDWNEQPFKKARNLKPPIELCTDPAANPCLNERRAVNAEERKKIAKCVPEGGENEDAKCGCAIKAQ